MSDKTHIASISFTVYGEPASKANQRRLVRFGKRVAFIKSAKALTYSTTFVKQCPTLDKLLEGDLVAEITIYYASRRPDLDPSLILDLMQNKIYTNDRQIKEMHLFHKIDRENPRSIINIRSMNDSS